MKKKTSLWIVPAILIGIAMCCHLGLLAQVALLGGFIDFPCAVRYDEANACLDTSYGWTPTEGSAAQMDVYLSTYIAGWSGGGCSQTPSDTPTVDIGTTVQTLHLERQGAAVIVNGQRIEPGERYEVNNWFTLHPWVTSSLFFDNLGVIPNCNENDPPRLVLVGTYGTAINFIKGGLILLGLIAVLSLVIALLVRQDRKHKAG